MSLHCSVGSVGSVFLTLPPWPTTHCWSTSLLIMFVVAAAAHLGGLEVSGCSLGCWTAPTFLFSGGFHVLTSSGTSFSIGLHSFKCFPFLLTTHNTAPRLQPSLLLISTVTSPSLQFHYGRFFTVYLNHVSGLDLPVMVSLGTTMVKLPQPDKVFFGPLFPKMFCVCQGVTPFVVVWRRKSVQASPNHQVWWH